MATQVASIATSCSCFTQLLAVGGCTAEALRDRCFKLCMYDVVSSTVRFPYKVDAIVSIYAYTFKEPCGRDDISRERLVLGADMLTQRVWMKQPLTAWAWYFALSRFDDFWFILHIIKHRMKIDLHYVWMFFMFCGTLLVKKKDYL